MADNIAYSPTHPAVGNVAWQPAGPYATIAYADDGYSVTPMTGYPSVYPHVLNIPPRINAFADLARTPMYQPDPQVMQWFMQMMTEAMKAMSAPMPRAGGSGTPAQPKSESKVDIPTVNLNLPEPKFNPDPMGSVVGDAITREPGSITAQTAAPNAALAPHTNPDLDYLFQHPGNVGIVQNREPMVVNAQPVVPAPVPRTWDDLYQKMWGGLDNITLEQIISALTDSGPAPQTWDDLYQKMWGN